MCAPVRQSASITVAARPPSSQARASYQCLVCRRLEGAGRLCHLEARQLRWGLIPYWSKDIKVGFANINAKAEGIENKPAFRKAFERRRCLVPVDNFYEWRKTATGKQPYRRSRHHAARGFVGKLAFSGRRVGSQLRDRHHGAEPIVRQNP